MPNPATPQLLTGWQRTHVLAAAEYLREILLRTPADVKARAVYDGLLDVLEPERRTAREEDASGEDAGFELRAERDRRSGADRRQTNLGAPGGVERRRRERRRAERRRP